MKKKRVKNPVARTARRYNVATVHTDRKKRQRSGYAKHKTPIQNLS